MKICHNYYDLRFLGCLWLWFAILLLRKNNVFYRTGTWNKEDNENSSNWKEFANLVQDFIEVGKKGWFTGNKILLATNNSIVEQVFYKVNSKY